MSDFPHDYLEEIDPPFWYGRTSLRTIYEAACNRYMSPWAVFAHCAANALSTIPPGVTLPPLIAGRGSLNMLFGVVARSGGGKDGAASVAAELTPTANCPRRNLGSGEGLVEAYRIPATTEAKKAGLPDGQHSAIRFVADEVDAVHALGSRTGSTILTTIRSSFNAAALGASTVRSGGFHLDAHSYRLTLVMSVQPTRGGWLFDDAGGGTPQRFLWFPARDQRALGDTKWGGEPLQLPAPAEWGTTTRNLEVPLLVSDCVRHAARRRNLPGGDAEELDGHAVFAREKLAMAMAVLDGRTAMTEGDWELSIIAKEVSDLTRGWIQDTLEVEASVEDAVRGYRQGRAAVSRKESEHEWIQTKIERITKRMVRYVADSFKAEAKPLTRSQLLRKFDSRERTWFVDALTTCTSCGAIETDVDGNYWPTGCVPADQARKAAG